MNSALLIAIAMGVDALLGEPNWLWSRVPHPAVIMGRLIGWCDRKFNTGISRKTRGVLVISVLVAIAWCIGLILSVIPGAWIITPLIAAILLAQRSLVDHVRAVAKATHQSIPEGRRAVAHIVGRDTTEMDETAIARSAIESAAENFSDGVIAPIFWFLLAGLPGLLIYKIVNTADSMIGYKTPRHIDFGWAAARLDDVMNWVPARLSALLIVLSHWRPDAFGIIRRDAPKHRSPNAGWPEAAMAVCIDVSLAGPRSYDGKLRDFPLVHPEGRQTLTAGDINAAVRALWRSWALAFIMCLLLALA